MHKVLNVTEPHADNHNNNHKNNHTSNNLPGAGEFGICFWSCGSPFTILFLIFMTLAEDLPELLSLNLKLSVFSASHSQAAKVRIFNNSLDHIPA